MKAHNKIKNIHRVLPKFNIGDKVLLIRSRSHSTSHKLNSSFIGPFIITQKIGNNLYSLKNKDNNLFQRVHRKFIRKYPDDQY